ncbi:MAG: hypothetical protein KDC18_10955 [Alphaproteobacteria bacterium]|nr:hypothetical protein [Alphaproteobacteria bacterium]MCB9927815.1 hypothetical protein [Alphaproteobacteria bacterium]
MRKADLYQWETAHLVERFHADRPAHLRRPARRHRPSGSWGLVGAALLSLAIWAGGIWWLVA